MLEFDAFCDRLVAELDLVSAPLNGDERLVGDLAFDSLLMFEMLLLVEDWAGVMLPEALISQLYTIGDVYDIYRTRLSQR